MLDSGLNWLVMALAVFIDVGRSIGEAVKRVQLAERLGYDEVWQTQLPTARDTSITMSAFAGATQRVRLGTGVLPIYTRHPTAMAQMAATLDELAGGRFCLGIGVSHRVTVEGMWGLKLEQPVRAMREYLEIVTALIRTGSVSVEGRYFTARASYTGPRREDMPIMISALNPRMLELAGELADGVVLWMCSPRYIETEVLPRVRAGRQKAGKDLEGFAIVAPVPASLTSNPAAGRDVFRSTVERYASLPFYRRMMDASGFAEELGRGQVSDAMVDELAGIGDEKVVRAAVRRYADAGANVAGPGPFGGHEGAAGFDATLEAATG